MAGLLIQKLSLNKAVKYLEYNPKESTCPFGYSPCYKTDRLFHASSAVCKEKGKDKGNGKEDSDKCVEKCSKKQRDVMTSLSNVQNRYLQPRNPILSGHKFTMSPPKVAPHVDVYIEEACRIREECRKLRTGGNKKK